MAEITDQRGVRGRPLPFEIAVLAAILATAVALRVYHLGYKSMWLDEINFAKSAFGAGGLFASFGRSILDHPPVYLFITRLVMQIGRDDWVLRVVPMVASLLAIVALWAWTRRLFGPATALVAGFLLAITPMHVEYSQEAHSYGLYGLLSILTLWSLYRAAQIETDPTRAARGWSGWLRCWGPFVALAVVNMYVHYYAFYVAALSVILFPLFVLDAAGGGIASLWREPARRVSLLRLAGALAVMALLYLPQVVVGVGNSLTYAASLDSTFGGSLRDSVQWAARAVTVPWERNRLASLGFAAMLVAGLGWLLWRRRALFAALLALLILPLIPSIWLAYRTGISFNARRVIFIVPVWVLICAVGLMAAALLAGWLAQAMRRRRGHDAADAAQAGRRATAASAIALVIVVALLGIAPLMSYYRTPKQDWKTLGRMLTSQVEPNDVVVAPNRTSRILSWYYPLVQPLGDTLQASVERLCASAGSIYVVTSIGEPLPAATAAWLGETMVEIPLKDLKLFYRNCNRYADEWPGAGAGPLFRMAYDSALPFTPTREAYDRYQAEQRTHLTQMGVAVSSASTTGDGLAPAQPFSLRVEAEQLAKAGDNEAALALYQSLVEFNPQELASRMGLANTLLALGRNDDALTALAAIQAEWPSYPWAYIREGQAKERTGQGDAAIAAYGRAIEVAPQDADVRFFVANVYLRSNRREDAIRELQAGLEIAPDRAQQRQMLEDLLKGE